MVSAPDCRHALLLQGPPGPFFSQLAREMRAGGAAVHKVHFHAGDRLFYRQRAVGFAGSREEWPSFLRNLIGRESVDGIFLYDATQPLHADALELAMELGIRAWVFDEGYLRPGSITRWIREANSADRIPRDPEFFRTYRRQSEPSSDVAEDGSAPLRAVYKAVNDVAGSRGPNRFNGERTSASGWTSAYRLGREAAQGLWRKLHERTAVDDLTGKLEGRYFVFLLQHEEEHRQARAHYETMAQLVEEIVGTFAVHSRGNDHLVLRCVRSHRLRDYGVLVARLVRELGLEGRVHMLHECLVGPLLANAKGTITINDSAGFRSLELGVPVIALGAAVYNLPGLTHQGALSHFLRFPGVVDREVLDGLRSWLLDNTQVVGSFYQLAGRAGTGLAWS